MELPVVTNSEISQPENDLALLNKDDANENTDESVEETPDETTEETVEEEPEEVEDEEEDGGEAKIGTPPFNKLRKDSTIGKFLKEYPQVQANYFKAEKYAEYFPTIEDAETAAQKSEIFDQFDAHVSSGDFKPVIDAVSNNNPRALENVADTILPMLQEKNPQLYVRAITPVIKQLFATAIHQADKAKNENLKNAAVVLAHFIWPNGNAPEAPKPREDPERVKLEQQNQQLFFNQYSNFRQSVMDDTAKTLAKIVEEGLDSENKLTKFTKDALIKEIIVDINTHIKNDVAVQKQMESLWKNSAKLGFSGEAKLSLKRAFLGRAKMLIPTIRSKRLAEALGSAPQKSNGKTQIPSSGGSPKQITKRVSVSEARQKGMSDLDILNYGDK